MQYRFTNFRPVVERLGVVLEPNGDEREAEGVLNPASAHDREGNLLLYPRSVAAGNVSYVGRVKVREDKGVLIAERDGYALEPEADYELNGAVGQGCEDPRVTFVPVLDKYLMAYTAYGSQGPRIAVAISDDGYRFDRLGLVQFPDSLGLSPDDKDAAFFPEPVLSPSGVRAIALYHRPMVHIAPDGGMTEIEAVLSRPAEERQSIRIAYIPLDAVLADIKNLVNVSESHIVLSPAEAWGRVKVGGGTPPVRIKEGWLSLYHGVDAVETSPGRYAMRYSAGIIVHDAKRPHIIRYRSKTPLFVPETEEELKGTVNNVVFPTALVPRPDLGPDVFDFYYGMADYKIGRGRLTINRSRRRRSS